MLTVCPKLVSIIHFAVDLLPVLRFLSKITHTRLNISAYLVFLRAGANFLGEGLIFFTHKEEEVMKCQRRTARE